MVFISVTAKRRAADINGWRFFFLNKILVLQFVI